MSPAKVSTLTHARLCCCRYRMHPGMFDACIHLAPVPSAGAPIAITRVPVAASSLLLPPGELGHVRQGLPLD